MSTGLHKDLDFSEIHTCVAYVYTDEAARLAATGFVAADLYKLAYQISTGTLWVLQDYSPITWSELATGSSQLLNKVEVKIIKATPGTLTVGQAVRVTLWDSVNNRANCELAKADSFTTMPCTGIVNVQATDTSEGKIMLLGILHNIDTSAMTALSPTYLSAATAGVVTTTPPSGPNIVQPLGICLKSDASTGVLGVNILSYRPIQYASPPNPLGVAAAGTSNLASASDHVHLLPKLDDLNAPDDNTDLDASTTKHGLLKKLGGGTTNYLRADGTWAEPPGTSSSVFGNGYQTAVASGASTTTSSTFQDKVTLTTPALPAGIYRVGWVARMKHASAFSRFAVQCLNVTDGGTIGGIGEQEPKDTHNENHISAFEEVTFTGAPKVFKIQFRSVNGSTMTTISEARIEIWRVS